MNLRKYSLVLSYIRGELQTTISKNLLCVHHQRQLLVVETDQLCQTSVWCKQLIGPRKFSAFINGKKLKSYIVLKFVYIRRTTLFSHIYL